MLLCGRLPPTGAIALGLSWVIDAGAAYIVIPPTPAAVNSLAGL